MHFSVSVQTKNVILKLMPQSLPHNLDFFQGKAKQIAQLHVLTKCSAALNGDTKLKLPHLP